MTSPKNGPRVRRKVPPGVVWVPLGTRVATETKERLNAIAAACGESEAGTIERLISAEYERVCVARSPRRFPLAMALSEVAGLIADIVGTIADAEETEMRAEIADAAHTHSAEPPE